MIHIIHPFEFKTPLFCVRMDSGMVIKVADFGLSESMDITKEYFRQNLEDSVKLPMKWLAPECINDRVFSEKTDVVSYRMWHTSHESCLKMGSG